MQTEDLQLTLGPNLYFWSRQETFDFYRKIAETPVDSVYLGETVCSKRRELRLEDWIEIGRLLESQGKRIILSTLTMLSAESDLKLIRRICAESPWQIEANDVAAVHLLESLDKPFVAGPALNIYNGRSLALMQRSGCQRWVMPVELSRASLQNILEECRQYADAVPETEIFSYGLLPLAYSARCFTARHHKLPKDDCRSKCQLYPKGLPVLSQEQTPVFTLNGIQTQSGVPYDLSEHLGDLAEIGVRHVRLSPEPQGMPEIIIRFDAARRGETVQAHAESCNGYWLGKAGMEHIPATEIS